MTTTRREWITSGAALLAAASPLVAQRQQAQGDWYDRPMRWMQVAFVEDDPGQYDPKFWLDYFARSHCDAACLSAGGCVAFYPTEVPLHYRSKFMGNTDPFGELLAGCRKLGMNVIARTDPHAAHQDVYDAHPDWIAVDAQGKKRRHWAMPELWVTCALGPYNFDFMTAVTREIVSKYTVDGIFSNRWAGSGMCYCEHCRKYFREFSGLDLPRTLNPQDKARREYLVWHQKRLFDLWSLWDQTIKAVNPHASFIANAGGGALSDLDMKTIGERAPTLFADKQARRGTIPPWVNGKNGKEFRATMGRKAVGGIVSVGVEEPARWKDSVQSSAEIRLYVADGTAQGLRPWFTKFNAKPIDTRWLAAVEDIYKWHYRSEKYLRNERNLARVAMVYSQQTATYYGGEQAHQKVEDPALGYYHALIEARIPFEMVHDRLLDAAHLEPYRTLILPNIAALSDAQCEQLRQFVSRGGSLVATYETSMYDEWGVRRKDFGLADLFGASYQGLEGPLQNSYLNIEKDHTTGQFHPLVRDLEEATRIINGTHQVKAKPTREQAGLPPLTLVPSYPDLPMEEVYARVSHTDTPGVYVSQVGKGRVVYFPADLDRTFWDVLAPDHGVVLKNAVLWAHNEPQPVEVTGHGMFDVAVWQQTASLTVHLVNLTNPMMMKGPVREIIPAPAQRVRLSIPQGRHVTAVRALVAGGTLPYRASGSGIELTVSGVGVHEVIAVDLA